MFDVNRKCTAAALKGSVHEHLRMFTATTVSGALYRLSVLHRKYVESPREIPAALLMVGLSAVLYRIGKCPATCAFLPKISN